MLKNKQLKVLHLSDVHFGITDPHGKQDGVVNGVISAIHGYLDKHEGPDLLLFTGDLTQKGTKSEFKKVTVWLKRLYKHKKMADCAFFVIPGNHEVKRPAKKDIYESMALREFASRDIKSFEKYKKEIYANTNTFNNFLNWHKEFKAKTDINILSNWGINDSNKCQISNAEISLNKIDVKIIGLNTALLSCDNADINKLVVEPRILNQQLNDIDVNKTLVFVLAHHPVDKLNNELWLAEWCSKELHKTLVRANGPHVLFHGHVHEMSGNSIGSMMGQNLTTLGAGACYQHDKYPMRFSFYTFNLPKQAITPYAFKYNKDSGEWDIDTTGPGKASINAHLPKAYTEDETDLIELRCSVEKLTYENLILNNTQIHTSEAIKKVVEYHCKQSKRPYQIVKLDCKYLINSNGDCSIVENITIKPLSKTIHIWTTTLFADQIDNGGSIPAKTFEDINLIFDSDTSQQDIAFIPMEDNPYNKSFSVYFLPEIKPNKSCSFSRTYNWKGLIDHFVHKNKNVVFNWSYKTGAEKKVTALTVEFEIANSLGSNIYLRENGDTRNIGTLDRSNHEAGQPLIIKYTNTQAMLDGKGINLELYRNN